MEITIHQLRMLREVARHGTIAAAADQLGYTASAVSQQLSSAEKTIGVAFLERAGRNVVLTDAGRELVRHAEIVIDQLEQAAAAIERVTGEVAGLIRFGFFESVTSLLGPILAKTRCLYPELTLSTTFLEGPQSPFELVRSGSLDLSFAIGHERDPWVPPPGFTRAPVCRDWFRLVVPSARLAELSQPVDLALLAGEDFIAPPDGSVGGAVAMQAFHRSGLAPRIIHQVDDSPTTLRLVAADAGVALVPDLGLRDIPAEVLIFETTETAYRSIDLIYRTSSADRPAVKAVLDVVNETVAEMGLDPGQDSTDSD